MPYPYFTTIAQVKAAGVPVAGDVTLELLQPYFFGAEQYLALAIGYPLIDQVLLGAAPSPLLELVKRFVAGHAVRSLAAINQRSTTATGTAPLTGSKENTSTAALHAQHIAALSDNRDEALEAVLFYLEEHPADFPAWHASRFCTRYPGRYFQHVEQLREYPDAPESRPAFRKAQGALLALTAGRVLPVLGHELHARLVQELDQPEHAEVLQFVRTALAGYLVGGQLHAAECALVELRWLLQRSPELYPEFLSSPSWVPTDIGPTTSASSFNAFY